MNHGDRKATFDDDEADVIAALAGHAAVSEGDVAACAALFDLTAPAVDGMAVERCERAAQAAMVAAAPASDRRAVVVRPSRWRRDAVGWAAALAAGWMAWGLAPRAPARETPPALVQAEALPAIAATSLPAGTARGMGLAAGSPTATASAAVVGQEIAFWGVLEGGDSFDGSLDAGLMLADWEPESL